MRRNAIVATLLVLAMSAGIGFIVGGGRGESDNAPEPIPAATPQDSPATPSGSTGNVLPFFRIVDEDGSSPA